MYQLQDNLREGGKGVFFLLKKPPVFLFLPGTPLDLTDPRKLSCHTYLLWAVCCATSKESPFPDICLLEFSLVDAACNALCSRQLTWGKLPAD